MSSRKSFQQEVKEWQNGKWKLGVPTLPGTFKAMDLYGNPCADQVAYQEVGGGVKLVRPWGGYLWSVPNPTMPDLKEAL